MKSKQDIINEIQNSTNLKIEDISDNLINKYIFYKKVKKMKTYIQDSIDMTIYNDEYMKEKLKEGRLWGGKETFEKHTSLNREARLIYGDLLATFEEIFVGYESFKGDDYYGE